MAKKLSKEIEGTKVTLTEVTTNTILTFDTAKLSAEIQAKLIPFGAGHKLGDAAAGKEGQEAVDSINKVWEGLLAGNWSVKAPASEKISASALVAMYNSITNAKDRTVARGMLEKVGLEFNEDGSIKPKAPAPKAPKAEATK